MKNSNFKKLMVERKKRAQALRRAENKVEKLMKENGFSNMSRCDFGSGVHGYQFGLYDNGVNVNLKQRKDGSYYVSAELLPWLKEAIEKAGFKMTPEPKEVIPTTRLRVVAG